MTDALDRIAAALERLSPAPPVAADPLAHPVYAFAADRLVAARPRPALPLALLVGIDRQKAALAENLRRLSAGLPAHDVLLWGARGTGKSAVALAAAADVQRAGGPLGLVQVRALDALPNLFDALAPVDRPFAVFVDDLGFDAPAEARALRSLLEGGAHARPDHVRLLVTSNRRHLLPRDIEEQASAINPRDAADDHLALADRFGLSLGFHALDQDAYLAIVRSYAARFGLAVDDAAAIGWATRRGSRSGRVAWQFIVDRAGAEGIALDVNGLGGLR